MGKIESRTVSLYPFCVLDGQPAYLVLRRAPNGKLPGAWQVVHGHVKKGETAARAAVRELLEETRLEPHALWSLDYVETIHDVRADEIRLVPCFAALVSGTVRLSREHDDAQWLPLDQALAHFTFRSQREAVSVLHADIALPVAAYGDGGEDPQPHMRLV